MFKKGCMEVGADSLNSWYKVIPYLQKKLSKDEALYKSVYMFTFEFSQEQGYKNISQDLAEALWEILLKDKCGFMDKWLSFLAKKKPEIIKKDQWESFYLLCV